MDRFLKSVKWVIVYVIGSLLIGVALGVGGAWLIDPQRVETQFDVIWGGEVEDGPSLVPMPSPFEGDAQEPGGDWEDEPVQPKHEVDPVDHIIEALILVESGGDDDAVGDLNLQDKAYGPLQIRQPAVADYNRWHGTQYRAEDCLGSRELSVQICKSYLSRYATEKRLGREPTAEDKARIWNGGPNGHKKSSTVGYAKKVRTTLQG